MRYSSPRSCTALATASTTSVSAWEYDANTLRKRLALVRRGRASGRSPTRTLSESSPTTTAPTKMRTPPRAMAGASAPTRKRKSARCTGSSQRSSTVGGLNVAPSSHGSTSSVLPRRSGPVLSADSVP